MLPHLTLVMSVLQNFQSHPYPPKPLMALIFSPSLDPIVSNSNYILDNIFESLTSMIFECGVQ